MHGRIFGHSSPSSRRCEKKIFRTPSIAGFPGSGKSMTNLPAGNRTSSVSTCRLFYSLRWRHRCYFTPNVVLHGGILDTDIDHASQFADGYREFGWPLIACYTCTEEKHTCLGKFNFSTAGWDILFNLSILALVVIPLEWAERRRPWLRWHVAAGMALFVAMEILLLYDQCLDVLFALSVMASPILAAILIVTVLVTPRIERSACSDHLPIKPLRQLFSRSISHPAKRSNPAPPRTAPSARTPAAMRRPTSDWAVDISSVRIHFRQFR